MTATNPMSEAATSVARPVPQPAAQGLDRAWPASHPAVVVKPRTGYVGLDYRDETIVAVICATGPRPAA